LAAVWLGAFCAGYDWQPMVDFSSEMLYSFNTTMALVGFVCGTLYFIGYSFGIFIFIRRNVWSSFHEFVREITLAICDIFVGTDVDFPKNWLRDVVGERDGEDVFLDSLRLGFSIFLGFMVASTILIIIVSPQYLWTTTRYYNKCQNSNSRRTSDETKVKVANNATEFRSANTLHKTNKSAALNDSTQL
jgi:hypothetical protein